MILIITSCDPVPKADNPDTDVHFKMPADLQKTFDMLFTCNKKESEITISDAASQNKMAVEDAIESKDYEITHCDGTVSKGHGPVRNLEKYLDIAAPEEFKSDVSFIKIENPRTCSENMFDTDDSISSDSENLNFASTGDKLGKVKLHISDSTSKMLSFQINVADGKNVLNITYYGKCLKYRDAADHPDFKNEYYRCLEAETLGTKEILLDVQVKRTEVSGIEKTNTCPQKQ
jgi:hypothetical protein